MTLAAANAGGTAVKLVDLYNQYLAQTGEPVAAAILAVGETVSQQAAPRASERAVLTPPQVAKKIGCAPETVIGWIRGGALKASNLANGSRPRYIVDPDDLARFLSTRQPTLPMPRAGKQKSGAKNYRAWRNPLSDAA